MTRLIYDHMQLLLVIPAKAGIQCAFSFEHTNIEMDLGFRWDDELLRFLAP